MLHLGIPCAKPGKKPGVAPWRQSPNLVVDDLGNEAAWRSPHTAEGGCLRPPQIRPYGTTGQMRAASAKGINPPEPRVGIYARGSRDQTTHQSGRATIEWIERATVFNARMCGAKLQLAAPGSQRRGTTASADSIGARHAGPWHAH